MTRARLLPGVGPHRRRIVAVALALLAAELAVALVAFSPWTTGDSAEYLALAGGIAHGHFGVLKEGTWIPEALRPPGYPTFLALVLALPGAGIAAVVALQMALMLPTALVAVRVTARLGGSVPVLAALTLLYPFPWAYAAHLSPEAVSIALVTVATGALVHPDRPGWGRVVFVGAISALAALTRPNLVLLPPLYAAVVVGTTRQAGASWRASLRSGVLLLAVTAVLMTPYAVRNRRAFGVASPLPTAGALGNSLFIASWQSTFSQADVDSMSFGIVTENMERIGFAAAVREANRRIGAPADTPPFSPGYYSGPEQQERATRVLGEMAVERIRSHPGPYLNRVLLNQFRIWNTAIFPPGLPPVGVWVLTAISALVWALGLGVIPVLVWRRVSLWRLTPSLVLLYFHGIHVWLHTEARYTAPARLLLMVNAAWAVALLGERWRPRNPAGTGDA